jgi:hypothetical protein
MMNEVDAGCDRATPASVRQDADEPLDSRRRMGKRER